MEKGAFVSIVLASLVVVVFVVILIGNALMDDDVMESPKGPFKCGGGTHDVEVNFDEDKLYSTETVEGKATVEEAKAACVKRLVTKNWGGSFTCETCPKDKPYGCGKYVSINSDSPSRKGLTVDDADCYEKWGKWYCLCKKPKGTPYSSGAIHVGCTKCYKDGDKNCEGSYGDEISIGCEDVAGIEFENIGELVG